MTGTQTIALHDSAKEVGDMAVQFLDKFSQPQTIKHWQDVMRDFNRSVCPRPSEYDDERVSVEDHIANYTMISYTIGPPTVAVNFGGTCSARASGRCVRLGPGDMAVDRAEWRHDDAA